MRFARSTARAGTMVFAATLLFTPVTAQSIRGTVKDRDTGAAISDASVVLMDDDGKIQRGTLAEENGDFFLLAPAEGNYVVRIGAAGYVTFDTPRVVLREERTQLLDIVLTPDPSFSGPPRAFVERMELGVGDFITRNEIQGQSSSRFTEVLELSPAVSVVQIPVRTRSNTVTGAVALTPVLTRRSVADISPKLLDAASSGRTDLVTVRINTDLDVRQQNVGASERDTKAEDCVPVLWVDGIWWGDIDSASPTGPDGALVPADITGIEIYHDRSTLPEEFNSGLDSMCGVVVVWTKRER